MMLGFELAMISLRRGIWKVDVAEGGDGETLLVSDGARGQKQLRLGICFFSLIDPLAIPSIQSIPRHH